MKRQLQKLGKGETFLVAEDVLNYNLQVVGRGQTFIGILSGAVAGILGVTGMVGFGVFLLTHVFVSCFYCFGMAAVKQYPLFRSTSQVFQQAFFQSLFSFVLFWTLAFNLVHLF